MPPIRDTPKHSADKAKGSRRPYVSRRDRPRLQVPITPPRSKRSPRPQNMLAAATEGSWLELPEKGGALLSKEVDHSGVEKTPLESQMRMVSEKVEETPSPGARENEIGGGSEMSQDLSHTHETAASIVMGEPGEGGEDNRVASGTARQSNHPSPAYSLLGLDADQPARNIIDESSPARTASEDISPETHHLVVVEPALSVLPAQSNPPREIIDLTGYDPVIIDLTHDTVIDLTTDGNSSQVAVASAEPGSHLPPNESVEPVQPHRMPEKKLQTLLEFLRRLQTYPKARLLLSFFSSRVFLPFVDVRKTKCLPKLSSRDFKDLPFSRGCHWS